MNTKYTVPLDFDIEGFKEAITRYKDADIYAPSPAIYSIPFSDLEHVTKDSRFLLGHITGLTFGHSNHFKNML